jgi:hypothetical protein
MLKLNIGRLPMYSGDSMNHGHGIVIECHFSRHENPLRTAQEAIVRCNVIVNKAWKIARPKRPSKVPGSVLTGVIVVESIDDMMDEIRQVDFDETALLAGKAL